MIRNRRSTRPRRSWPAFDRLEERRVLALPLDYGFGTLGSVQFPFSSDTSSTVAAEAIEPTGEILVAGTVSPASGPFQGVTSLISVAAVSPTGVLDPGFGKAGVATIAPISAVESASAVAIDANGDIDVVGTISQGTATNPTDSKFVVIRILPTGQPDTSFGGNGNGQAVISFPSGSATAGSIVIQPDGKIVVAGDVADVSFSGEAGTTLGAARLNADGTIDTSYGSGGFVSVPLVLTQFGEESDKITGVHAAVQPDGKIVLGGSLFATGTLGPEKPVAAAAIALSRLDADGSIDTSFGADGVVISNNARVGYYNPAPVTLAGLAVQPNGQILYSGDLQSAPPVYRLNSDGSVDGTFISSEMKYLPGVPGGAIALQPDGKVVVIIPGYENTNGQYIGSSLLQLNTDGTIDDGFATGGETRPGPILADAVSLQPDGKILLAGVFHPQATTPGVIPGSLAAVARYIGNAPPGDYFGNGTSQLSVDIPQSGVFQIASSVGTNAQTTSFGPPSSLFAPIAGDFNGDGLTDLALYDSQDAILAYRPSGAGADVVEPIGMSGGIAVPVNSDLGGFGSVAVYYPQFAVFANLTLPSGQSSVQFGVPGISLPAVGDFDGAGVTELAYYIPKTSTFSYRPADGSTPAVTQFGPTGSGFLPAIGDYDGDGKSDLALYSSEYSVFLVRPSSGGPAVATQFGPPNAGFVAIPGDYDGDGKTDLAIYNAQYGLFIYRPSSGGADRSFQFGPGGNQAIAVLTAGLGADLITQSIRIESLGAGILSTADVIGSLDQPQGPVSIASTPISPRKAPALPDLS